MATTTVVHRVAPRLVAPDAKELAEAPFRHARDHVFTHEATWAEGSEDNSALWTKDEQGYLCAVDPQAVWERNSLQWPCWLDHGAFTGTVYPLPVGHPADHRWLVRGAFCSPHCLVQYAAVTKGLAASTFTWITCMLSQVYGYDGPVVPAADVATLLHPGWKLSLEAWRAMPAQRLHLRLLDPARVPFRLHPTLLRSFPDQSHPGHHDLLRANGALAQSHSAVAAQGGGSTVVPLENMTMREYTAWQSATQPTATAAAAAIKSTKTPRRKRANANAPPAAQEPLPKRILTEAFVTAAQCMDTEPDPP